MLRRRIVAEGHLIESNILKNIIYAILEEKGDYEILDFHIGKDRGESSYVEVDVKSKDNDTLDRIISKLIHIGCFEKKSKESIFKPAPKDKNVPDDFYSTTNYRSMVYIDGIWHEIKKQRMDAVVVKEGTDLICKKLRDVKQGDSILCSSCSVKVFPTSESNKNADGFGFMQNDVSSERSVEVIISALAKEIERMVVAKEKIVVVAGPVVVHTGGASSLADLIKRGFVHGLLGGNAVAVHDIENAYYGTSLGVDLKTGIPVKEGNRNHMRAINRINFNESIKKAVENDDLKSGIMYEVIKSGIPFALAGSLRDDGPLPDTITDMIEAQAAYSEIIKDTSMIIMLSSMLHSIATGNMLPAWVKTICVDINPAVVTKLADRGSGQAIGIITDVGLFLRSLAQKLH